MLCPLTCCDGICTNVHILQSIFQVSFPSKKSVMALYCAWIKMDWANNILIPVQFWRIVAFLWVHAPKQMDAFFALFQ